MQVDWVQNTSLPFYIYDESENTFHLQSSSKLDNQNLLRLLLVSMHSNQSFANIEHCLEFDSKGLLDEQFHHNPWMNSQVSKGTALPVDHYEVWW